MELQRRLAAQTCVPHTALWLPAWPALRLQLPMVRPLQQYPLPGCQPSCPCPVVSLLAPARLSAFLSECLPHHSPHPCCRRAPALSCWSMNRCSGYCQQPKAPQQPPVHPPPSPLAPRPTPMPLTASVAAKQLGALTSATAELYGRGGVAAGEGAAWPRYALQCGGQQGSSFASAAAGGGGGGCCGGHATRQPDPIRCCSVEDSKVVALQVQQLAAVVVAAAEGMPQGRKAGRRAEHKAGNKAGPAT
ncbi:hypothetical protein HaLaN_05897 [Haematococcus lacustris]|uniref:Uncharacterized protein n=1 Tax=Haematococcus lacustris TaxID=44745 RepID=A0A699YMN4_HAELA|nr:hypothetical protein HaLaN_05897 [Haematococcus lacustris]